ncbi:MAG: GNAT family N-acetyltransferase [Thermoleophilia bacterium]
MDVGARTGEGHGPEPATEIWSREAVQDALSWEASTEPLVASSRGGATEEVHRGVIAVADAGGRLLGGVGNPHVPVLLRSAAKPFQALAIVASGAADALHLTDAELAVICASHAGEEEHVRVVATLLERLGLSSDDLVCGTHPPFSRSARAGLQRSGARPSPLQNNCSGKHAGMLGLALFLEAPLTGYEDPSHPVQREIARTVSRLLGREDTHSLLQGIDGCGVPVLRMSAVECATLFARLIEGAEPSLRRVRDAMVGHPALVGGEERFDTRCMRLLPGDLVSKAGAAGAQGLGLAPGVGRLGAVGCFMKLADGSSEVIPLLSGTFLRAWGEPGAGDELAGADATAVRSLGGRQVGRMQFLTREADLRRRESRHADWMAAGKALRAPVASGSVRGIAIDVGGGRDRTVVRFLREEWPAADEEILGRTYDWSAESLDLVAREGRKVVGVLRGHFTGGVATINELLVHRGSRRTGIGTRLVGVMEEAAVGRGCHKMSLRTPAGSEAEGFYRGLGYSREYLLSGHHYGHDYVGMSKRL